VALQRRVMAGVSMRSEPRSRSWRFLAASLMIGALLGGAVTFGVVNERGGDVANEVVSAQIRALMAPQPVDVQSSDRHTVKPWFAGKLAFAPKVIDLSARGFQLVGARIDVIELEPAASLVYSNGKHFISVVEMPSAGPVATPVETHAERGYFALSWSDGAVTYWAVSDMAPANPRLS
jgi:anti-sigma factor RsiW